MGFRNLIIGIMFLSQTTAGLLGNLFFLSHYLVVYYHEHSLKTTDLILKHLIMANTLIILYKGVPHTMTAFGLKQFFNVLGCRFLFYFDRVGRSMSIVSTCMLSVFQAITISPRNSCCKDLKVKAPKSIGLFISLCWILYMVINSIFPMYILSTKFHSKNRTEKRDFEYCSSKGRDAVMDLLYTALLVFPEVLLSVLIICSSGSMVVILYKHRQRVQHIRSTNTSSRASPESRATQSILILVSTFLTFYTLSSIVHAYAAVLSNPSPLLLSINGIIYMCFPSTVPFTLMSHYSSLSRLCCVWIKKKKFSNLIRNT
uniref:vomeronasal type-1 receptor 4-like n=1 Tax=Jaculus jaculus TaxID=51337 RepID=UPI001E1B5CD2|nr:vomeronasal type-1 receptor 4-like [Jaculus jaculus]